MKCSILQACLFVFKNQHFMMPIFKPNGIYLSLKISSVRSVHNGLLSQKTGVSTIKRHCSSQSNGFPKLTNLPIAYWPNFFNYAKNFLCNYLITKKYDEEFDLERFMYGSKQAVGVVSNFISRGRLNKLDELVKPDVVAEISSNLRKFSLKQVTELRIHPEDIYMSFPYEMGIIIPEDYNEDIRFVEITMCYHVLSGFKEMASARDYSLNFDNFEQNVFILNYKFFKDYSFGKRDGPWIISGLNHCKPLITEY